MDGASTRPRTRGPRRGRGVRVRGGANSRPALQLAQENVVDDVAVRAEYGADRRPGPSTIDDASKRPRTRGPRRGRGVRVRSGANSRAAPQLAQDAVVDDVILRAEHGALRRPGPSNLGELLVYETDGLPVNQPLETLMHVKRRRLRQPSQEPLLATASSGRTSSVSSGEDWHCNVLVKCEPLTFVAEATPSPPSLSAPSPTISGEEVIYEVIMKCEPEETCVAEAPPPLSAPSPAIDVEYYGGSAPGTPPQRSSMTHSPPQVRQSVRDEEVGYGSEPGSDESNDELMAPLFIPRVFRSAIETPIEEDDMDTVVLPAAEEASPSGELEDVPPTATDQPWRWYDFDWREFPSASDAPALRREAFSQNIVGPTIPCVDPYEIFVSIWDRQFMEYIASETNRYAQQVASHLMETNHLLPNSRISRWQDTTADELYVYFGITIAMGVVLKSRMEEYWGATPDIFYTPGFSAHMSINRYILLNKCLHFNNNDDMCALELDASEARLFKIKPVLSHLNIKFQYLYTPKQNIALDESLLQRKGCLAINQFIPNKAASVGIKTYEICESQTGYLWRFEIHAHKKSPLHQLEDPLQASTPSIVLRLIQGLENKGYTLWMDNFYNSPCLARRLKALGTDCVGTLRTNRQFVPQALNSLSKANMRQGDITGLTSGDVDVMVWRDRNCVAMISTYHGMGATSDGEITKPILILDYNVMMGGLDKKDQMLSMYPIERKRTRVWYKKLFKRLLNVSVLNSYIIHHQSAPHLDISSPVSIRTLTHRNFRISLVKSLLTKHYDSTRIPALPMSPTAPPLRYDVTQHRLVEYPRLDGSLRSRRKCCMCPKRVSLYCAGCDKAVCLTPCFLHLHSK